MNAKPKARGGINATQPRFTPGQWRAEETETRTSIKSGKAVVAYVQIRADQDDNAALIACAPELFALAMEYASECGECAGVGVTIDNRDCDACRTIREVIAKATRQ